jgi:hypothetical protein
MNAYSGADWGRCQESQGADSLFLAMCGWSIAQGRQSILHEAVSMILPSVRAVHCSVPDW